MKKTLLTIVISCTTMLITQPANAEDECQGYGVFGMAAMTARQNGMSYSQAKSKFLMGLRPSAKDKMNVFLEEAYKLPVSKTKPQKEDAIKKFANLAYSACQYAHQ